MNILIIRLSALGDVVHTLPAVHLLKKHIPGCTITWVVEEAAADLLRGCEGIDRLIVSRRKSWLHMLGTPQVFTALREISRFIAELRGQPFDLVLDFQGLLKSGVLAGLARGTRKIGFAGARECAGLFYTEQAASPAFNDHAIRRHLGLLRHVQVPDEPVVFSRLWGSAEQSRVGELLAGNLQPDGPLVLVHPAAAWPTKCWNPELIACACDQLQEQYRARIVFIGARSEQDRIAAVMGRLRRPAETLAGRTTLRELACLLSCGALLLATDSGPLHLACAVGTPAVALFGPTAPWRTGPFGGRATVLRRQLGCSPCYKRNVCPLGHHSCMNDIEIKEVLAACAQYLAGWALRNARPAY